MRAWTSALAVAGLVVGVGLAGPAYAQVRPTPPPTPGGGQPQGQPKGQPQAQGNTISFNVCNKSKIPLFVAMLWKVSGDSWRYAGWAQFKPGQCGSVGQGFPKDDSYWYAEDGPGKITYAGNDAQACVNPNDSFDRTVTGNYSCQPGEKIVGFTKVDQKAIAEGVTLLD